MQAAAVVRANSDVNSFNTQVRTIKNAWTGESSNNQYSVMKRSLPLGIQEGYNFLRRNTLLGIDLHYDYFNTNASQIVEG